LETKNVFIDTSIFIRENFGFNSERLCRIKQLAKDNEIKLYSSYITEQEVKIHIKEAIDKSKGPLKELKQKGRVLNNNIHCQTIFNKDFFESVKKEILDDYQQFIQEVNMEYILINSNINKVIRNYFGLLPPFSSRKKSEFPDAFVLDSITIKFKDEDIFIISCDSDWEKYCKSRSNFKFFSSIQGFFDYIEKENMNYQLIETLFDNLQDKIVEKIRSAIIEDDYGIFDASDEYSSIENIEDCEVKINEDTLLIEKISNNIANISFEVDADIQFKLSVMDENNSFWDSEDKEWGFVGYKTVYWNIHETLSIELDLEVDFDNYKDDLSTVYLGYPLINGGETIYIEEPWEEY
jgi:predicted nucleic acid-binding protein